MTCKIGRLLMLRAPSAYSCSVFTCIASWKCTFKCSYVGTRTESFSFFIVENDWIFCKYLHLSVKLTTLHHTSFMLSCKLMICSTANLKSSFLFEFRALCSYLCLVNLFSIPSTIYLREFCNIWSVWVVRSAFWKSSQLLTGA